MGDKRQAGTTEGIAAVGGAVGGITVFIVVTEAVIAAVGFTSTGIAAGSAAAGMMSAAAIANGGGIAAGSAVAVLQGIGAVGLGTIAIPVALVGAALGAFTCYAIAGNMKPLPGQPLRGVYNNHFMVLTEEGIGNVVFYAFPTSDKAWEFWHSVTKQRYYLSRIFFNQQDKEVAAGGWNALACHSIRRAHMGSTSKCQGQLRGLLKTGDVVSLYSPLRRRFVRMKGECVDAGGGEVETPEGLPAEWMHERFTVVLLADAFPDEDPLREEFALHSQTNRRFVRLLGERVDAKGGVKGRDDLPRDWGSERFTLVGAGDGLVAIHSREHNRFLRLDGSLSVNARGGPRDRDCLPDCWDSERFRILIERAGDKGEETISR